MSDDFHPHQPIVLDEELLERIATIAAGKARHPGNESGMQKVADSALLKVASYAITAIMVPSMFVLGTRLVERIDRLEVLLAVSQTDKATMELRLHSMEALAVERGPVIKALQDKVLMLEFKMEDQQRPRK